MIPTHCLRHKNNFTRNLRHEVFGFRTFSTNNEWVANWAKQYMHPGWILTSTARTFLFPQNTAANTGNTFPMLDSSGGVGNLYHQIMSSTFCRTFVVAYSIPGIEYRVLVHFLLLLY